MNVFLNESAYNLIKGRGVCSPASVMEALGNEYQLRRPIHNRANPGQLVRLDLVDDGEERLKHLAITEYPQPMTVSDYVSRKIVEHFGGGK